MYFTCHSPIHLFLYLYIVLSTLTTLPVMDGWMNGRRAPQGSSVVVFSVGERQVQRTEGRWMDGKGCRSVGIRH